ncbi:MAG: hypothetical protein EA397_17065 [Deltaproteobacteria bacterium]|nr:MAG: hypothetical protein EA397_17065 [Deltaproteobacteria bacterium]
MRWSRWCLLVFCPGCVAWSQHIEGLAVWPILFSAEADDVGMEVHAGTSVLAASVDVERDLAELRRFPVEGAEVSIWGGGADGESLAEVGPGLYVLPGAPIQYAEGEDYRVEMRVTETQEPPVFTSAPAATPLITGHVELSHSIRERLHLDMPQGYAEEYDQILVTVAGPDGEVTWSNHPSAALEWLDFVSARYTPDPLEIPRRAFPTPNTLYGVTVIGLVRARAGAERSSELRSEFSGFTTGSGKVVPVWAVP